MRSLCLGLTLVLAFAACASPGGHVEVREVEVEVDLAKAAAIAASLVGPLREIEASLRRWEACLQRQDCQPETFLSETEAEFLRALRAPELAGMRDWVREDFRYRKSEIEFYRLSRGASQMGRVADVLSHEWDLASGRRFSGGVSRTGIAASAKAGHLFLASQGQDRRRGQDPAKESFFWDQVVPSVFGGVTRLVRRARELVEANELVTRLCVQSSPPGAQFILWPSSEPARSANAVSVGTVVMYRGLYAYNITLAGKAYQCDPEPHTFGRSTRTCSKVDLVNDGRPVFRCAGGVQGNTWSWQCDRREGLPDGCPGQS